MTGLHPAEGTVPAVGAVVAAAGRSSRMGSLKPLLPLADGSFLRHETDLLSRAGVRQTVVVTGREARRVTAEAAGPHVVFVHNPDYAATDMLHSVKLGLAALPEGLEGAFVLPADTPMFTLFTLFALLAAFDRDAALRPVWGERSGHPLLLGRGLFPRILGYDGPGGLRGALAAMPGRLRDVPVPDPGVALDADCPGDYRALLDWERSAAVPDRARCLALLDWFGLSSPLRAHAVAVADRAVSMAEKLRGAGLSLDIPLTEAAALLHDIAKGRPRHGQEGARLLRLLGMPQVADAMERHADLPETDRLDEAAVVFLADKLFCGTTPCTLAARYDKRLAEFGGDPQAAAAIRARKSRALSLWARYRALTGDSE